jgi:hypothetical protein
MARYIAPALLALSAATSAFLIFWAVALMVRSFGAGLDSPPWLYRGFAIALLAIALAAAIPVVVGAARRLGRTM